MPPTGQPSKYAPITRYLAQLPAGRRSVRLTFAEIETLIGGPLSATAQTNQSYWTTTITARLDRVERAIAFTRQPQE